MCLGETSHKIFSLRLSSKNSRGFCRAVLLELVSVFYVIPSKDHPTN